MIKSSRSFLRYWLALVLGRVEPASHGERRNIRFVQAAVTAVAGRGLSLFVSIIAVPLTVGFLGVERYGLWITISTLLVWLQLADIGLGNGLTNALSEAYGEDNPQLAQKYTATVFWLLVVAAALITVSTLMLGQLVNWERLFQVTSQRAREELGPALVAALVITCLGIPLNVADKVYTAYQEGMIANLWAAIGSIASLVALFVIAQRDGSLLQLVVALAGVSLVVKAISTLWLFLWHKPWLAPTPSHFDRSLLRRLSVVGVEFFVLQVATLVLFQSDNLIIVHYLGPDQVASYSVVYRLFAYITLIQGLMLAPLWPAYGEAAVRGDWLWVRHTFRRSILSNLLVFGTITGMLCLVGQFVVELWTDGALHADQPLILLMGLWTVMMIWGNCLGIFLNGLNVVRSQAILAVVMTGINLVLSLIWVNVLGVNGVILGTIVSYAVSNMWIAPILGYRELRRRELRAVAQK